MTERFLTNTGRNVLIYLISLSSRNMMYEPGMTPAHFQVHNPYRMEEMSDCLAARPLVMSFQVNFIFPGSIAPYFIRANFYPNRAILQSRLVIMRKLVTLYENILK